MQVTEGPEEDGGEGTAPPNPTATLATSRTSEFRAAVAAQVHRGEDNLCRGANHPLMEPPPHVTSVCQTPSVFTQSDTQTRTPAILPRECRTNTQTVAQAEFI